MTSAFDDSGRGPKQSLTMKYFQTDQSIRRQQEELRTHRPPYRPRILNHLESEKNRPKIAKILFCHLFADFWPISGSGMFFYPVEGRVIVKGRAQAFAGLNFLRIHTHTSRNLQGILPRNARAKCPNARRMFGVGP